MLAGPLHVPHTARSRLDSKFHEEYGAIEVLNIAEPNPTTMVATSPKKFFYACR